MGAYATETPQVSARFLNQSFLNAIERWQWWIVLGLFAVTFAQGMRRQPLPPPDES